MKLPYTPARCTLLPEPSFLLQATTGRGDCHFLPPLGRSQALVSESLLGTRLPQLNARDKSRSADQRLLRMNLQRERGTRSYYDKHACAENKSRAPKLGLLQPRQPSS